MLAGGVTLASAPAASAADNSLNACTLTNQTNEAPSYTYVVYGSGCLGNPIGSFYNADFDGGATSYTAVATNGQVDTILITGTYAILYSTTGTCDYTQYIVASDYAGAALVPSRSGGGCLSAAAVPDWVQSYGRFGADATCEDGWSGSWQEWAVDVTGGWVCTRNVPSRG